MAATEQYTEGHLDTTGAAGVDAARARWAVTAVFFINGLTLSSYIVRVPSLKVAQHLSDAQLGVLSTVFGASALVAMQFVGGLVARYGSRALIRLALVVMPLVLVGIGLAPGFVGLCLAGMVLGAVHGTIDVSMNGHAVVVQRSLGRRPIMSVCHAAWSISAVAASLIGGALIAAHVTPLDHFLAVAVVVLVAGVVTGRYLLPPSADAAAREAGSDQPRISWRTGWSRTVIALGLTGTVLMIGEGASLTWSGVLLHDSRGASLAVASLAVTAYTACQTTGRLAGDWLTTRIGATNLFRIGGLIAVVGFCVAFLYPHPAGAVAGFGIAGLGGSSLIPLTFSAVGHAGGIGPGAAAFVARFTTFTYSGILLGPAIIGWAAQGIGLQWTLAAIVPLIAAVAVLTRLPSSRS